jgi:hypothetical protein
MLRLRLTRDDALLDVLVEGLLRLHSTIIAPETFLACDQQPSETFLLVRVELRCSRIPITLRAYQIRLLEILGVLLADEFVERHGFQVLWMLQPTQHLLLGRGYRLLGFYCHRSQ